MTGARWRSARTQQRHKRRVGLERAHTKRLGLSERGGDEGEESEEEELVAARRQAKEQLADGIAIGMERVRMRNESLRAFVEKRFQSRHVDKTFVEAEYHLARRHASAQRSAAGPP